MKTVVLAIEFDEDLDDIIHFTTGLLKGTGTEVFVVHAYESHAALIDYLPQAVDEDRLHEYEEKLQRQAKAVQGIAKKLLEHDMKAHGFMKPINDSVWQSIIEFATEKQAEMIIVGTHHPNRIERFILGSVAEQVVRNANIPVAVIPRKS